MAATKYEVMCRYYNVDMKMPITNIVNETWISCFEENTLTTNFSEETFEFCTEYDLDKEKKMQDLLIYGNNYSNPKYNMFFIYKSREIMYNQLSGGNRRKAIVSTPVYVKVPSSSGSNAVVTTLSANEEVIYSASVSSGGKTYIRIRTLDGTFEGYVLGTNLVEITTADTTNYVLKDRMERILVSPWFIHSVHGSLNSAMTKARQLANLVGHDNIKIGKVVPLEQYIEIV